MNNMSVLSRAAAAKKKKPIQNNKKVKINQNLYLLFLIKIFYFNFRQTNRKNPTMKKIKGPLTLQNKKIK